MGTTPTYSWPYPEPTDPVANGAQDIEDLALAVESTVSGFALGKILQVVSSISTTAFSTTSGSEVSSGISATITPTSATSTVLGFLSLLIDGPSGDAATGRFWRGTVGSGTQIGPIFYQYGISSRVIADHTLHFYDSPATTSATTYNLGVSVGGGSTTVFGNASGNRFTLLEVSS